MADARPFRGLRYDATKAPPSATIAPPYDVISPEQQRALYERSPYNIVRVEYGEQRDDDAVSDDRYTRAAAALNAWRRVGVLIRDDQAAIYRYEQHFEWDGRVHRRTAYFATVRLEEWDKGVVKPHERTLSGPKQDRLDLLRATHAQVSPVYSLFRPKQSRAPLPGPHGDVLYDFEADGQRHVLSAVRDPSAVESFQAHLAASDIYIADGHHRYETALTYRDERRGRSGGGSDDEPEAFVLMALSDASDPGLLVLPTHRIITPPSWPDDALARIARHFTVAPFGGDPDAAARTIAQTRADGTAFAVVGLEPGRVHILTLRDRPAVEALMPVDQAPAWKRLDVNILQYGILDQVFGIDVAVLAAGGAVSYTQDARAAADAAGPERGRIAFLLNATPVEQVLSVADAGGRMPQKSTYFYPKLPTGLVMNSLDA